jgi:hypothetical protein
MATRSQIDGLSRWKMVTGLDAAPSSLAEAGFGGSRWLGMVTTEIHE